MFSNIKEVGNRDKHEIEIDIKEDRSKVHYFLRMKHKFIAENEYQSKACPIS